MSKPFTRIACRACGWGTVVLRVLAVEKYRSTHWFECQNCGYSTPGRATTAEAMYDVNHFDISSGRRCTPLGEFEQEGEE